MKKTTFTSLFVLLFATVLLSSCSSINTSMREPNMLVEFDKADFELSEQIVAEAASMKVLGIDWKRLFNAQEASVGKSASIFGAQPFNTTSKDALYNLLVANPGYDVIFYPQYEVFKKNFIIFSTTKVKATAKLGKITE